GYRFDKPNAGDKFELPGLWFSEKEATALVLMQHLLSNLDTNGLLSPHIAPLMNIIDGILGQSEISAKELRKRIKVFGMSARKNILENFEEVGVSLLKRQRLHLSYYSKGKDELTERTVSPQRLIFYRDNWYLDAHCHMRKGLRSFVMDGIQAARVLEEKAIEVSEKELHENFAESYGIFSGNSSFDKDGNYLLEFDYNQDPELVMEIMKHGDGVEVISPVSLRKKVVDELRKAAKRYEST
ncbi:MAG: WYL domain-containing protein, partial [Burkholderiaceae bacterium]|nr:WYL domain-containing protein [Burkholderiaceae bacterium]